MATTSERMAFVATIDTTNATAGLTKLSATAQVEGSKVEQVIQRVSTLPPPKMPLPPPVAGTAISTPYTSAFTKIRQSAQTELSAAEKLVSKFGTSTGVAGKLVGSFGETVQKNKGMVVAAIAAMVVKSVADYEKLALAVESFSKVSGTAAEDASRWIEVADDYNVSTETMQNGFAKLEKAIATGKLKAFGLEVQHTKTGAVDMNATMLEAIRIYNQLPNAVDKANFAQTAFGKGWQSLAPVISKSADEVKKSLDEVSGSRIVTADQVKQARELSVDLKQMGDYIKGIEYSLAKWTVPKLDAFISEIKELNKESRELDQKSGGWLFKFRDAIGTVINPLTAVSKGNQLLQSTYDKLHGSTDGAAASAKELASLQESDARVMMHVGTVAENAADGMKALASSTSDVTDVLKGVADTADRVNDAVSKMSDAVETAFDKNMDAKDAADKVREALQKEGAAALELLKVEHNKKASSEQKIQAERDYEAVVRDSIRSVEKMAHAQADAQAAAEGSMKDPIRQNQLYIDSLKALAKNLSGPTKKAIEDLITLLEGVPTAAVTQVSIDEGTVPDDIKSLRSQLDELDGTTAIVKVDMNTDKFYAKLAKINADTENIGQKIIAPTPSAPTPSKPGTHYARGGTIPANQWAIVGEQGPELLAPKDRPRDIVPAFETKQLLTKSKAKEVIPTTPSPLSPVSYISAAPSPGIKSTGVAVTPVASRTPDVKMGDTIYHQYFVEFKVDAGSAQLSPEAFARKVDFELRKLTKGYR